MKAIRHLRVQGSQEKKRTRMSEELRLGGSGVGKKNKNGPVN